MINRIKSFFAKINPHHAEYIWSLPETNTTTPIPVVKPPSNISEPVLSIVKTFSEKGRWKVTMIGDHGIRFCHQPYYFNAVDTVTGESYKVSSPSYLWSAHLKELPDEIRSSGLPTWLTLEEKKFVIESVNNILLSIKARLEAVNDRVLSKDQKQTKANQDKERNRLMDLYCTK